MLKYLRDTTSQTGLRLTAHLVTQVHQKGLEVADEVMPCSTSPITRFVRNGTIRSGPGPRQQLAEIGKL
jgi:hypothetical protein